MYISVQNFGFTNRAKCFIADGFYEFPPRIHQFTEIQYIIEGELEIVVDGMTEHLTAGDVAVISPFRAHSLRSSSNSKRWILIVSGNFISDYLSAENDIIRGERCSFKASDGLRAYVCQNLMDMGDVVLNLDENKRLITRIRSLAYPILEEYISKIPQRKSEMRSSALASIIMYIGEHFKENITRSNVGAALGYSRSYISHTIECIPDMNFSSILNALRVEYAKKILEKGGFNVLDVALECGFGSERTFYRVFKDSTGMSPRKYIRMTKGIQHKKD